MDLLILDTSKYEDPLCEIWHASPRYTASYLRQRGINAAVHFVPVLTERFEPTDASPLAVYFEVSDDNVAPTLGFLPAWRSTLPHARLFVGGSTAGQIADTLLSRHPEIDGVVIGECDDSLVDATARVKANLPIKDVPGLHVRGAKFKPRALIENLDDLGMMVRDGFDDLFPHVPPGERVAYLLAGRGCYANCSFCSVPAFLRQSSPGKRWRGRSVELIVDEMESMVTRYGVHRFVFQDDNFFGPGPAGQIRARQFAREILHRRLQVEYFVSCRVNDIDSETVRVMKASGLTRLGVGVESLSQRSLSLFSKGYRADAVQPALEIVENTGISCEVNLIFFEPMMTLADVHQNLDFLEYVASHERITYSDSYPFKTLLVAPWSRIATKLEGLGALDRDGATYRYADQRVAALAEFATRLHERLPVVFKQRTLVASKTGLRASEGTAETLRQLASVTARLREWLGLTVLPRYMRTACNVVEQNPAHFTPGLAELEASFDTKMAVLRRLGKRLQETVGQRTEDLG